MRFKAVVFDLDGTLVDSAPGLHASINRLLTQDGRAALELNAVKTMVGDGVRPLVRRAYAATGRAPDEPESDRLTERFLAFYDEDGPRLTVLNPGARAVLEDLSARGIALGLCTNKPQAATLLLLESLGIDRYLPAVLGGDCLGGIRKPDPRHVLAVLDALRVVPDEAAMVGDSPNDVRAGRDAGLPVIAVSFGYPLGPVADLGADLVIDRFEELPGALERL